MGQLLKWISDNERRRNRQSDIAVYWLKFLILNETRHILPNDINMKIEQIPHYIKFAHNVRIENKHHTQRNE